MKTIGNDGDPANEFIDSTRRRGGVTFMASKWVFSTALWAILGVVPMASAQFPQGNFVPNYPGYPGGVGVPLGFRFSHGFNPYGQFGWSGFGGTAASANGEALASIIRAQGEYEVQSAQAATVRNELVVKERERRMAQRQAYFQMQQARSEAARERNIARRERRESQFERQHTDQYAPILSKDEFDPAGGKLRWPVVLQRDEFRPSRELIDTQLRHWAQAQSEHNTFDFAAVDREIISLRDQLKDVVPKSTLQEYFDARLFIDRLDSTLRTTQKS
jgi:hypothetical protein